MGWRSGLRATGSVRLEVSNTIQMDVTRLRKRKKASHQAGFTHADRESPVLFGGSTHRGEEEILASIFLRLRQQFPSLRLFIAPRHVERLREIRAQFARPANAHDAGKRSGDRSTNQTRIALFSIQQVTFIAGMLSPRLCSWGKA